MTRSVNENPLRNHSLALHPPAGGSLLHRPLADSAFGGNQSRLRGSSFLRELSFTNQLKKEENGKQKT